MKYIYVLEDEPKFQGSIYEAIRKSEPAAQIRFFSTLEAFQKWIAIALKEGQSALHRGGEKLSQDPNPLTASSDSTDELTLLVSKDEWLGTRYLTLLKKTVESFVRKKICTPEDPTRLVITAFENPDFEIKLIEDPIITNLIFKPFDPLILDQQLHYALKGHHPPSQSFVHKVQTSEEVEMTKDAQMEAVGDVGFVTRSTREIKPGQISKFYGDVFKGTGRIHVMARCLACEKHPDFPGEFRVWLSYFGIPSHQITDIRKSMVKRNEIEYSPDASIKQQKAGADWVILDSHRDRFLQYKKIIEKLFNGRVQHFSSFDTFYFQLDPIAHENSRKEKPWPDTERLVLRFDASGDFILKAEPQDIEQKKIFGENFADFKKHSFSSRLFDKSANLWRQAVSTGQIDLQELILVQNGGHFFSLQVRKFQKVHVGAEHFIDVEFVEPALHIRMDWYRKNFKTPQNADTVLIAEEFMKEERLPFWEEYIQKSQSSGSTTRYIGLFQKQPDEKFIRRLTWMADVFDETNETAYIERKLVWMGGSILGIEDHMSTPFLRSCQEVIRVANPVEIAELSETALVINYQRAIEVGAFRKFVLSKKAETFNENLAVCNYSSEHPTEKDRFQCHFVFFGVTDARLKSIRLWILENYVQSKQEED